MIGNAWILPRGSGYWIVVETEDMLFYLSNTELEPSGFEIKGNGNIGSFWVTTAKDNAVQFDTKETAERYLNEVCRINVEKQEGRLRGWGIFAVSDPKALSMPALD